MVLIGLIMGMLEVSADSTDTHIAEACTKFRDAIHRHDTYRRAYFGKGGPKTPDAGGKHVHSFRDAFDAGLAAIDATEGSLIDSERLKAAEEARDLASRNKDAAFAADDALARAAHLRLVYIRACGFRPLPPRRVRP